MINQRIFRRADVLTPEIDDMDLWSKNQEVDFFNKSLKVTTPETLFYTTKDNRYLAYWPKKWKGEKSTLQSRNTYIGDYTEKWSKEILTSIAEELDAYAVNKVVCEELSLPQESAADVAICKKDSKVQNAEDILAIFEVKMSIVWNWELKNGKGKNSLACLGDYRTHQGNPGLLRSDSMLKAIGKSINVRISSREAAKIPIIVLGNTPIHESYSKKVDNLKRHGIIQGFWSLNPKPLDNGKESISSTKGSGFIRFDSYKSFKREALNMLQNDLQFFAGMKSKTGLGKFIQIADGEDTYEKKATKFLELIGEEVVL